MGQFDLQGALAVVIGASQGIGQGLAVAFAKAGADVVIASRTLERLKETHHLAAAAGTRIMSEAVDVASPEGIQRFAATVLNRGTVPTVLVNSASLGSHKNVFTVTPDDWNTMHDVHLRGTFFSCQAFGRAMETKKYGKIINLSSIWAATTSPNRAVYGAAKAGVSHLTAALGVEWAPLGIRVNALAPAATRTPTIARRMKEQPQLEETLRRGIPLGRIAETDDMIGPALFLACPASDFVTGQTLFVDGGWQYSK